MSKLRIVTGAILFAAQLTVGVPSAGAASEPGARPFGELVDVGGGPAGDPTRCGAHRPPVDGRVIDPFRLPDGPYGAGNRGLEYATVPGTPARAIGAGQVTFAGAVAGRLAVSIRHRDGLISSVSDLASVAVRRGELVARGSTLGTTGERMHLGVREGGRYVDPAALFCGARQRAVLVPGRP